MASSMWSQLVPRPPHWLVRRYARILGSRRSLSQEAQPYVTVPEVTAKVQVGKLVMSQCASTLKKMTLELGGNGGWVVFEDADLDKAGDGE